MATLKGAPMTRPAARPSTDLMLAFGAGCLLTLMVLFNGQMAAATTPVFSSWVAHATGIVAATAFLVALRSRRAIAAGRARAPLWAYLGGISGAVTVILTSTTVNSVLALSGTLALGLLGQMAFGLASDAFGLFGLPRRRPGPRDIGALVLILAGSGLIIFGGGA
jgi:transporter family-2 protein